MYFDYVRGYVELYYDFSRFSTSNQDVHNMERERERIINFQVDKYRDTF